MKNLWKCMAKICHQTQVLFLIKEEHILYYKKERRIYMIRNLVRIIFEGVVLAVLTVVISSIYPITRNWLILTITLWGIAEVVCLLFDTKKVAPSMTKNGTLLKIMKKMAKDDKSIRSFKDYVADPLCNCDWVEVSEAVDYEEGTYPIVVMENGSFRSTKGTLKNKEIAYTSLSQDSEIVAVNIAYAKKNKKEKESKKKTKRSDKDKKKTEPKEQSETLKKEG